MQTIVSFDLDGTLVHTGYPDHVWLSALPQLYSEHYGISYEEARDYILLEYVKIGPERIEWYDIDYWFKKFGLQSDWNELLEANIDKILAYDDSKETLEVLKDYGFPLIIISNAKQEFIDIQLKHTGLRKYFTHVFSCTSDFGAVKKVTGFYDHIVELLGVSAQGMYHVGDHYKFDYEVPRELGIHSYYIDRKNEKRGRHIIHGLDEYLSFVLSNK